MKKIKKLTTVLAVMLVLVMSMQCFAATFTDVDADKYSWAIDSIESMAKEGIITGYGDGTYMPEKTVTKLESLVLISRILGSVNDANALVAEAAYAANEDVFDTYPINFGAKEVSYILMKDIITESELATYIGGENASKGLVRYELAILLTKALGAEDEVKDNVVSILDYKDADQIPAHAKKYVEYVTEQGIMQGMGDNMFSPNTDVTRAQIAVVLDKVQDLNDISFHTGMLSNIDVNGKSFAIKKDDGTTIAYTISNDTLLTYEGVKTEFKNLVVGSKAVLSLKGKDIVYSLDTTKTDIQEVVAGEITSLTGGTKITIRMYNGSESEKITYSLADNVVVTMSGEPSSMSKVDVGDYAELTISGDKVVKIAADNKTTTTKGTVTDIVLSPSFLLEVTDSKGYKEKYTVDNNVVVKKNNKTVTLSDVYVGDTVTLTLEYGVITNIVAVSTSTTKTGIIDEIVISNTPSVTLMINGVATKYALSPNAVIELDNAESNIYGLRLGVAAEVKLSGDTIIEISTANVESSFQITGKVEMVNTSYGLIQVNYTDIATAQVISRQIFVKDRAKIFNSVTGKDTRLENIKVGSTVSIVGTSSNGVFEASSIVIVTE